MSHLDQIARSGVSDGGPPAANIGPAPTGRANCSKCGAAIDKGTLRATTFGSSAFHDGYDASHYHALCAPAAAKRSFDPKATLLLPWRDQLTFSADEAQKDALRSNAPAQAANDLFCRTRHALVNDCRPKDVKQLLEENGYALACGPKPIPLAILVEIAADGLCFGRLAPCAVCGGRALRHAGAAQGAHSITWCTGWASASTPCSFVTSAPPAREACWTGLAGPRKNTKPLRALVALLAEADARARRDAPEPEARASKKARKAPPPPPPPPAVSARLRPVPTDSRLLIVDAMALQEAGCNAGARDASIVVTHGGCTAMNVQLSSVDVGSETNSFYRLQCFKFERGGFGVFTRWGRVGEDDGLRNYSAGMDSRHNKCMLHFHDDLEGAADEFAKIFKRHSRNDWTSYAAAREFVHQPGCYDIVRHADAELLADGEATDARALPQSTETLPALPENLDGLGVKALKALCAARGVDVSRCVEKGDLVEALRASAPAVAAPPASANTAPTPSIKTTALAAPTLSLPEAVAQFVELIMSKKRMEDELSRRNVDTSKFPLGEISPACIRAAYAALSAASAVLERPAAAATDDVQRARDAQAIKAATNDFLRAIPHQVARGGMAALRLDSMDAIRQKTDLVATLEQILKRLQLDRVSGPTRAAPEAPGDALRRQYASLKCDLVPVARDSAAYAAIAGYLRRGWPDAALEAVFESSLAGQTEAFAPHRKQNVQLLWHGSSLANWAGILSGGLRIAPPEAPANGYNFDKGLYFADVCAKSAQYCRASSGAPAVLCLAEVVVGDPLLKRAPDPNSNNARRLSGKDSVVAMGLREPDPSEGYERLGSAKLPLGRVTDYALPVDGPQRFMGHNEYIVYSEKRHRIRYVVQCRAG